MTEKRRYKRFTKEDDAIIKKYAVKEGHLFNNLEEAAKILNRPVKDLYNRFYTSKEFVSTRKVIKNRKLRKQKAVKKVIAKELQKNPNNISKALEFASTKTNLTKSTLTSGYYDKNSYMHRSNLGVCFALVSDKKVVYNGKNTEELQPKTKGSKSHSFIEFFKNLFK